MKLWSQNENTHIFVLLLFMAIFICPSLVCILSVLQVLWDEPLKRLVVISVYKQKTKTELPSRHNIQNTKTLGLHIVLGIMVRNIVRVFLCSDCLIVVCFCVFCCNEFLLSTSKETMIFVKSCQQPPPPTPVPPQKTTV